MTDLQLIKPKKLASLLGVHLSTIYRWETEGKMPIEKIKYGPNSVGYRMADVEKWLNGELNEAEVV